MQELATSTVLALGFSDHVHLLDSFKSGYEPFITLIIDSCGSAIGFMRSFLRIGSLMRETMSDLCIDLWILDADRGLPVGMGPHLSISQNS